MTSGVAATCELNAELAADSLLHSLRNGSASGLRFEPALDKVHSGASDETGDEPVMSDLENVRSFKLNAILSKTDIWG
jgi:hypothetical protein